MANCLIFGTTGPLGFPVSVKHAVALSGESVLTRGGEPKKARQEEEPSLSTQPNPF